jgi:hypothetical protein
MFTDIDRIIEQIEQIPWSDKYLWRDKDDFVKFIKSLQFNEDDLLGEISGWEHEFSLSEDRCDELQNDFDDLNEDYDKLIEEFEHYKELNESKTS